MTRPDDDASARVVTDALVLAAAALAAIAARVAADAERLTAGALPGEAGEAVAAEAAAAADAAARLRTGVADRGVDPDGAAAPLAPALTVYTAGLPGRDAAEVAIGVRLARGLVADLGGAIGGEAAPACLDGLDDALTGPAARVVAEAVADRRTHDRLAPPARRMLGEALVLVDALLAALPAVADAVDTADGGRRALVKQVKSAHGRRVGALGL